VAAARLQLVYSCTFAVGELLPDLAVISDNVVSTNVCIIHETQAVGDERQRPERVMPASITSHSDIASPILTR